MRQKYQILIEDKNGVWKQLDLGSDKLVWTYQVNDIAELVSRQASYSQNLRLPKTANNVNIFDHANNHDVVTDFPYKKHNCRVFCADRTIAGKGSFLILLKVTDYFECQVLSGNANFFETLQDSLMSDLDLGIFQVCNKSMNPDNWHPAYKILYNMDVVKSSYPFNIVRNGEPVVDWIYGVGAKYPALSLDYTLRSIMQLQGYSFESNISDLSNKYLSINSAGQDHTDEDLLLWEARAVSSNIWVQSPWFSGVQCQWILTKDLDRITNPDGVWFGPTFDYYMQGPGRVIVTIGFTGIGGRIRIDLNGETVHNDGMNGPQQTKSYRVPSLRAASIINIGCITTQEQSPGTKFNISIKIDTDETDDKWSYGILPSNCCSKLKLSERTGFETQFDFMKFFAQSFGLTFFVDEIQKHVTAFTMDLLYINVKSGHTKDWSSKVDRNPKSSLSFTLKQYAQENIISFEDNSKDEIVDGGIFYIDNKTLQFSKELFKIGIEAGQDGRINTNTMGVEYSSPGAFIPLVELNPPDGVEDGEMVGPNFYLSNANFPTIKPHLLEVRDPENKIPVRTAVIYPSSSIYEYEVANTVMAQDLVSKYYGILENKMLKNARLIEDSFYLTPEDVEQFDPSIPVYIDKYGAYFYVNKIRNFEIGRLTACELVRL